MKKKTNILLTVAVALLALAIILWVSGRDTDSQTTSEETNEVTVMIYANDEELANDTLDVSADTTLMEIMEENYELSVTDEGFIEAIEGVEQSIEDNEFWVFEANEEMVTESAEDFVPEDGDTILWELMAF
ncbi:DUF4430 domain-containing protein [Alkalibacterium sp. 20]|uniref:DUF4430 domain-containing protein n=1 Tax=Alkalibacterium sp. 20 TaxID=1798803 RepID=UPI0008FFF33E|nr:DUF4430 domain-containing protein [Alkalibacterium sp. 20]OJF95942.1 hypothetical protein AX762_05815 [Alkalibacterium sp. 20]